MSEKIIGYILILSGIGIILFSALSAYNVFTGINRPAQLFKFDGISINLSSLVSQNLPEDAKIFMEQNPVKQEIMPASILNNTTNVLAHYLLMGFIASIGFKIASLGTLLVRPVVVKLKTKENSPVTS